MVRLRIVGFEPGVHEIVLEPEPEDLELAESPFRDIEVDIRLDRKHDRVFVSLEVSAIATLECDRTLVDFDQPVAAGYDVLFAPLEMVEASGDKEDVRLLRPEDEELDLTDIVRDTLLLAIPQRKVAPGAEDVEIPTRFGAPRESTEIDPRWAALRTLLDQKDESADQG